MEQIQEEKARNEKEAEDFFKTKGGRIYSAPFIYNNEKVIYILVCHIYISRGYTYIYIKGGRIYSAHLFYDKDKVIYIPGDLYTCLYIHTYQGGIHTYISRGGAFISHIYI